MHQRHWSKALQVAGASLGVVLTVPALAQNPPAHNYQPGYWQPLVTVKPLSSVTNNLVNQTKLPLKYKKNSLFAQQYSGLKSFNNLNSPSWNHNFSLSTLIGDNSKNPTTVGGLASQIATNLLQTYYVYPSSKTREPQISYSEGSYNAFTDCSGFVSYVLSQVAPQQYKEVLAHKESDQPWPRAFVYRNFFSGLQTNPQPGWALVTDLRQAENGDILSWCGGEYCAPQHPLSATGDTGHIMVVNKVLQLNSDTWSVIVYDSSNIVHYGNAVYGNVSPLADNSLPYGNGTGQLSSNACQTPNQPVHSRCGVGVGAIHIKINLDPNSIDSQGNKIPVGAPIDFQFGPGDKWHPTSTETVRIAIGRVILSKTLTH